MTSEAFGCFVAENWGIEGDHPFASSPDATAFRHPGNKKWFALMMEVPAVKLGSNISGMVTVVNAKCDAALQSLLLQQKGFYPAYHMNKQHWISAVLPEIEEEQWLQLLIEESYRATK